MQRLQCGGGIPQFDERAQRILGWVDHDPHPGEDCGHDIWTGQWPGEDDAIRLGWWCYFVPWNGFIRCGPDHPEAMPDLNRLVTHGTWNRELLRWEAQDAGTIGSAS